MEIFLFLLFPNLQFLGINYITYCMSRYRNVANLAHVKANIHLIVEDYDFIVFVILHNYKTWLLFDIE